MFCPIQSRRRAPNAIYFGTKRAGFVSGAARAGRCFKAESCIAKPDGLRRAAKVDGIGRAPIRSGFGSFSDPSAYYQHDRSSLFDHRDSILRDILFTARIMLEPYGTAV